MSHSMPRWSAHPFMTFISPMIMPQRTDVRVGDRTRRCILSGARSVAAEGHWHKTELRSGLPLKTLALEMTQIAPVDESEPVDVIYGIIAFACSLQCIHVNSCLLLNPFLILDVKY